MRAALLALALVGCSYGFGDLVPIPTPGRDANGSDGGPTPTDPRAVIDAVGECNPVSNLGCIEGSTYCLGKIESNQTFSRLVCRGSFGSGSYGTFCSDLSFCVPRFLCWVDPADPTGTHGSCEMPCFADADCAPGHTCLVGGSYAIGYAGATMYRCSP